MSSAIEFGPFASNLAPSFACNQWLARAILGASCFGHFRHVPLKRYRPTDTQRGRNVRACGIYGHREQHQGECRLVGQRVIKPIGLKLRGYPRAHAVVSLQTGTLSVAAATLIQARYASRLAAIKAVKLTAATFDSMSGLMAWLQSDEITSLSDKPDWPTSESHQLWLDFVSPNGAISIRPWKADDYWWPVKWHGEAPDAGTALRIGGIPGKEQVVFRLTSKN